MENLWYALPAVPLLLRLLLALSFSSQMIEAIPAAALDRTDHRMIVFPLAGFSFAGLLALLTLPGDVDERSLAIWYILLSFLAFFSVLNIQQYKSKRWHDMLGDALLECATLCLISSVIGFIATSDLGSPLRVGSICLGTLVWAIDFFVRLKFTLEFLQDKESANAYE